MEEESANDLGEALADSDKGGQDAAPITGPTSTTPFEGLFQVGFLDRAAALLLLLESEPPSAVKEISGGGDEEEAEAAFEGEQSEKIVCSGRGAIKILLQLTSKQMTTMDENRERESI